jgi:hypothetical protein
MPKNTAPRAGTASDGPGCAGPLMIVVFGGPAYDQVFTWREGVWPAEKQEHS